MLQQQLLIVLHSSYLDHLVMDLQYKYFLSTRLILYYQNVWAMLFFVIIMVCIPEHIAIVYKYIILTLPVLSIILRFNSFSSMLTALVYVLSISPSYCGRKRLARKRTTKAASHKIAFHSYLWNFM